MGTIAKYSVLLIGFVINFLRCRRRVPSSRDSSLAPLHRTFVVCSIALFRDSYLPSSSRSSPASSASRQQGRQAWKCTDACNREESNNCVFVSSTLILRYSNGPSKYKKHRENILDQWIEHCGLHCCVVGIALIALSLVLIKLSELGAFPKLRLER